jgi:hypothetical protein
MDTDFGHKLAGLASLSDKQAAVGKKMVLKYRRQLPEALLQEIKTDERIDA